jgi:hypothetical protein
MSLFLTCQQWYRQQHRSIAAFGQSKLKADGAAAG